MYVHLLHLYIFACETKIMKNTNKLAETKYPINEFIVQRWSARSFSNKAISKDELNTLFEAASWAPSSMNEQPWHYLYAHRGSDGFESMTQCLMDGNKPWAKNGSTMLISLAKKTFDKNGNQNRHHMHDVGAANAHLLLQAASMGIYGHEMGGFHLNRTIEVFGIDSSKWEIACFIVLGFLDAPEKLDEPYATREITPRKRKTIEEFTQALD